MKKLIYLLFFLALMPALTKAQGRFDKVDSWLADNVSKMGGRVVLLVYKDGKVVYSGAKNGMNIRQQMFAKFAARRAGKAPNTADLTPTSRLPVASCSKWYSAALVMTFVDEGKLKLNDTVGKYLPVLSKSGKGGVTISQCLSHLTGIKAPPLKESLQEMRNEESMDEAMQDIAAMPMEGKPGTTFRYSNTGLQIAGAVIEKISGKSFNELFIERIARPLGMKNTDFGDGKVALPAGGAYSTPEDYLSFLVMILNNGTYNGRRVLSENSVREMKINRVTDKVKVVYAPAEAGDAGYGYGEWVLKSFAGIKNNPAVSSPGLFGSFPWVDTDKNYAAFMMCYYINSNGRNERYRELKKLVDDAVAKQ